MFHVLSRNHKGWADDTYGYFVHYGYYERLERSKAGRRVTVNLNVANRPSPRSPPFFVYEAHLPIYAGCTPFPFSDVQHTAIRLMLVAYCDDTPRRSSENVSACPALPSAMFSLPVIPPSKFEKDRLHTTIHHRTIDMKSFRVPGGQPPVAHRLRLLTDALLYYPRAFLRKTEEKQKTERCMTFESAACASSSI